jgi:hypothetical protein
MFLQFLRLNLIIYFTTGRMTTSAASSALGFLNPKAAKVLGIPTSLRHGGGMGAYYRLIEKALPEDVDIFNAVLIEEARGGLPTKKATDTPKQEWELCRDEKKHPFVATYVGKQSTQRSSRNINPMSVRMHWGNAQEATSILTALNYFCTKDRRIRLREVGMCVGPSRTPEHPDKNNCDHVSRLLLGASPDALIQYQDGTVEVLEVKNHCPFYPNATENFGRDRKVRRTQMQGRFRIRAFDDELLSEIPLMYLPQLMMEMYSVGPHCKSAVMVRQTATNGVSLLQKTLCRFFLLANHDNI